eukprot:1953186-Prymnesium_polylepis.2
MVPGRHLLVGRLFWHTARTRGIVDRQPLQNSQPVAVSVAVQCPARPAASFTSSKHQAFRLEDRAGPAAGAGTHALGAARQADRCRPLQIGPRQQALRCVAPLLILERGKAQRHHRATVAGGRGRHVRGLCSRRRVDGQRALAARLPPRRVAVVAAVCAEWPSRRCLAIQHRQIVCTRELGQRVCGRRSREHSEAARRRGHAEAKHNRRRDSHRSELAKEDSAGAGREQDEQALVRRHRKGDGRASEGLKGGRRMRRAQIEDCAKDKGQRQHTELHRRGEDEATEREVRRSVAAPRARRGEEVAIRLVQCDGNHLARPRGTPLQGGTPVGARACTRAGLVEAAPSRTAETGRRTRLQSRLTKPSRPGSLYQ